MADDVTFQPTVATPPSGTKVATDDVGGSHFQKVKLDLGGDGASAPVTGTVPVSGTVLIDDSTPIDVNASVSVGELSGDEAHDDPDAGNPVKIGGYAKDDYPANVAADDRVNAWFTTAGELHTTIGYQDGINDNLNPAAVIQASGHTGAGGPMATAPMVYNGVTWDRLRGDAANGTDVDVTRLPALPSGTNNIGDVDVLTVPSPLSTAGNGTAATAHRVTIASDSTGQVTLAAGSAAIGKLAANSGVDIGDVDVTSLPAIPAGNNNIGDVDVLSVPSPLSTAGNGTAATAHRVTLASDSTGQVTLAAGSAAIGKLAANSGVDIGDVDVTSLPALPAGTNNIGDVDVLTVPSPLSTAGNGTAAAAHRVTIASDSTGVIGVTDNAGSLTVDAADGTVFVRSSAASTFPINVGRIGGNVTSVGSGVVDTGTQRVVLPTDVTVPTKETRAATGTTTSVASSATNVTLLASNANRLGATIFNDSTQNLFVKFGATASSSSFAVKMTPGTYYEVPFSYTGIIDGIWASANGNARITELT